MTGSLFSLVVVVLGFGLLLFARRIAAISKLVFIFFQLAFKNHTRDEK
jgi:hypothetical protein